MTAGTGRTRGCGDEVARSALKLSELPAKSIHLHNYDLYMGEASKLIPNASVT